MIWGIYVVIKDLKKYAKGFDEKYGFVCFKQEYPAGTIFPMHWHEYIEFEFVVSGKAKHVFNDEKYILERGNAHILSYYDFHEITVLEDIVLYCIHFDKNMLHPKIFEFLSYNSFRCKFDETELLRITDRIQELLAEKDAPDTLRNIMIKNLINELMIMMIRKCKPSQIDPAPLPIQQAISYLNEHFYEKITLEKMAKELSFSANYIGKLFKNQMKCSFNEYVNTLRLKHACSLLTSSNMSIKEIADASGYSSIEYFMYAFKKKMMMTPGEYRSQKNT